MNFLDRFFEKSSNTKSHKIPSIGIRIIPFWWTDGRTWRS